MILIDETASRAEIARAIDEAPASTYQRLGTEPEGGEFLLKVPRHLQAGIARWVLLGVVPGDFLQAVIRNDLFGALGRADVNSRAGMFEICQFFYNGAPSQCFGRPEAIDFWHHRGGLIGRKNDA